MLDKIGSVGSDIERYLDLLSKRQQLVASNIANADTPGYRTQDIDFQTEFAAALQGSTAVQVREVSGLTVKNDGNNVSLDREARLLAETALRFRLGVQLLKGEVEDIRKAMQGP
jgi:flagellar basal-body rod protein FlgB